MTNQTHTDAYIAEATEVARTSDGELFSVAVQTVKGRDCLVLLTPDLLRRLVDQGQQALNAPLPE